MKLPSSILALGVAGLLLACGNNPQERTTGGAAAGAATGAAVGALAGPPGMAVGALVGGGAGAVTGAATKPSQVNLGKPPWTNPDTRVPTPNGTATTTSSRYRRGPDSSQNAEVDRLNDQSLQAAQGGQLADKRAYRRPGFDRGEVGGWGSILRSPPRLARPVQRINNVRMPLLTLSELRATLTSNKRLLGIDPGHRTIGVALSDVALTLASPYGAIRRGKLRDNAGEIAAIAGKEDAGGLVVGLPLAMDGSFGPSAQAARDWALALSDSTGLPVTMWDERLSSAAVNRFLIEEADISRRKRSQAVDRMAAAWLLQGALDSLR